MERFDLNKAISGWRKRLRSDRAFLADDLDELESHLRDHVEVLISDGHTERDAFFRATGRLGSAGELEVEYRKVRFGKSKRTRSLLTDWFWNLTMLKSYFKTTLRSFARHKGFTAINLIGLAVGLAGCVLIGIYIYDELSYDNFHDKGERIYRLGSATVGWPYGRILEAEYPEVEDVVYMRSYPTFSIEHESQLLFEDMLYADAGFFNMFGFPVIEGDPDDALTRPYSLVLSASLAERLFGDEPAVGRGLVLGDSIQFNVTGVARVPEQSHIQFDVLLSFETLRARSPDFYEQEMSGGWLDLNVVNYVLLREGVDADAFADKIRRLPMERAPEYMARWGSEYLLDFERADRIYLHSDSGNFLGPRSTIDYVYLLIAVGLFLLIIAAVNFVNLTTARSADRAREVGVRKVVGSSRGLLVRQFLGESFILCVVALVLAIGIVWLALPWFNSMTLKTYSISDVLTIRVALTLVVMAIVVGGLAGLYPALSLSSYRPAEVLKGRFVTSRRGRSLRRGLVVFQFVVSGTLILATFVVMNQLRYMQGRDLGFDSEQLLVLDARRAPGDQYDERAQTLMQALESHAAVQHVSSMYAVPGRPGWRGQISFPEGFADDESVSLEYLAVDHGFVETLGLEVVAGRDFDRAVGADATEAVLINEAAVTAARWNSPHDAIGKQFPSPGSGKPNGVVVGVVADYHHHGLQERIAPMMYGIREANGLIALRMSTREASAVVAHVENTWEQLFGGYPHEQFFLDEDFARQYTHEERLRRVFTTFAALTILIACLGLFALAAYAATQRTKEIGVRKVLGATVPTIAGLLVKDFVRWVLLAFALSVPIAYYSMTRWLDGFAYRTSFGVDTVLTGGLVLLLIAVLTVTWTAVRAARIDPVHSLRYE